MNEGETFAAFLPIIIICIVVGLFNRYLAKEKGYNHGGFLFWIWCPILNYFGTILFAGLPDKILHDKIDRLMGAKPDLIFKK